MKIVNWLTAWLFPEKCVLCGRILEKDALDLCHKCRVEAPECGVSRIKYPFIDTWTALWYYQDHVRRSILRFKFHGRRNYAAAYARMLGMRLMKEDGVQFDCITWVPISDKRKKKRGYDQGQLLAEKLSQELQIPMQSTLKKIRNNPPQSGIVGQAHRKANVMGVYVATQPQALAGKRILLLDDILTTGATAGECARILLTAGAKEVHLAVVAAANQQATKKTGR